MTTTTIPFPSLLPKKDGKDGCLTCGHCMELDEAPGDFHGFICNVFEDFVDDYDRACVKIRTRRRRRRS